MEEEIKKTRMLASNLEKLKDYKEAASHWLRAAHGSIGDNRNWCFARYKHCLRRA